MSGPETERSAYPCLLCTTFALFGAKHHYQIFPASLKQGGQSSHTAPVKLFHQENMARPSTSKLSPCSVSQRLFTILPGFYTTHQVLPIKKSQNSGIPAVMSLAERIKKLNP